MKAVLISIQPKWVEKIASGEKTIEVRKSRPKLKTPFKCYIYCTNDRKVFLDSDCNNKFWTEKNYGGKHYYNGKVIGEFVCDEITPLFNVATTSWNLLAGNIHEYAKGKNCFAWHISDLKIYDKPKELDEFHTICDKIMSCSCCEYHIYESNESGTTEFCGCYGRKPIKRPPQSWCYVEELQNG